MSYGKNAKDLRFQTVTVFGTPMLFTESYVDPETLPKGVYQYLVRHHSEDLEKPVQITDWAVVNRMGSLLTTEAIPLDKIPGSYVKKRSVDSEKDWEWNGYFVKLHEYLERYPVQKSTQDRSDAR